MPTNLQKARELFLHAVGNLPPDQWESYVSDACSGDADLEQQVGCLLQVHREAGSFLEAPAPGLDATLSQSLFERPGTQIGPYKLLQQIGEGGFGIVFMAEQVEPVRRRVALKVIKPGMDTRQVIARFEAERQALAVMDHPNIARVLDAGATESGRPYFVMELVRGTPITQYCDENNLPIRERLELFATVCQAIQHAHTKGIIHRDIKPSNVLVTRQDGQPVAKVIDFGIAKAMGQQLTDKTLFTDFAQMIGTPLYMSPEQAELSSNDIDTRSDIYSLGVLLYELLTGSTPVSKEQLKQAAFDEIRRIIREEEPPKPSTRISSTDAAPSIAAQRHTEPSKLAKLVRGELDWIVMKALEKDRNRRYETANGFAQDLQRYLTDEPVLACPPSLGYRLRKVARRNKRPLATGAVVAVTLLFAFGAVGWAVRDREARREEAAREEATRQAKLEDEIHQALNDVADSVERDQMIEALAAVKRAEWILTNGVGGKDHQQRVRQWRTDLELVDRLEEIRLQQADATIERESIDPGFGDVFRHYGLELANLDVDEPAQRIQASAVRDRLVAGLHDWARWERLQGNPSWKDLLAVASRVDPDPWRDQLREAVQNQDTKTLERLATDADLLAQAPATLLLLAMCFSYPTDHIDLAVDVLRNAQKQHPDNIWINTNLGHDLVTLRPSRTDEAVGFFRAAVALRPQSPGAHVNLGNVLTLQGKWLEAEAEYREALCLKQDYGPAHLGVGNVLRVQSKLSEAEAEYREALRIEPKNGTARRQLVNLLSKLGRVSELEAAYREAVHLNPDDYTAHCWLGAVLYEQRRYADAAKAYREAVRLAPLMTDAHGGLGLALMMQRQFSEAETEFREALRLNPTATLVRRNLARSLSSHGKFLDAEAEWREVIRLDGDDVEGYFELGRVLSSQCKFAEAESAYREAVRIAPSQDWTYYALGSCLIQLRRRTDAESAFREAIRLNPNNAGAHQCLGFLLRDKRDWEGALGATRKAIALDPKNGHMHLDLARTLRAKGDLQEAIVANEQAISLMPTFATGHFELGHLLKQKGDTAGAIAAYRKALELDPEDANLWYHLALAWELATCADPRLREPAEAVKLAQEALDRNAHNAEAFRALGVAHYRAGDWQAAAVELEKAIQSRYGGPGSDNVVSSGRLSPESDHTTTVETVLFLAMCHWQAGESERARACYDLASDWIDSRMGKGKVPRELPHLRAEAAALLEIKE